MTENGVRDLIIIGGGPAGYTAALYAARANLEPLVIEGFQWGGQLMITSDVENYPGYAEGVLGPEMMKDFRRQAERFGAEFVSDDVTRVDFSEQPFRVWVGEEEYRSEAVIVATGANARQLGLESEVALQGRGVSYCAVCDAAFFRERNVVVVGGGDSAMEEATFLTKFATKVTVVHRRDEFRASQIMEDRARANDKIEFITNAVVDEVLGEAGVTAVTIRDVNTDEITELPADGLFVAIGHDPNTKLFVDWLDLDAGGYIITKPGSTETNIEGVFAVGDVVDHVYRQAVTAAGMGCMGRSTPNAGLPHAKGTWPRRWRHPASRSVVDAREPRGVLIGWLRRCGVEDVTRSPPRRRRRERALRVRHQLVKSMAKTPDEVRPGWFQRRDGKVVGRGRRVERARVPTTTTESTRATGLTTAFRRRPRSPS